VFLVGLFFFFGYWVQRPGNMTPAGVAFAIMIATLVGSKMALAVGKSSEMRIQKLLAQRDSIAAAAAAKPAPPDSTRPK
jgi:hypothetical protein